MILVHRYRTLIGYHRRKDWELKIASRLSSTFIHRMDGILSRKMANVLWGSKQSYKLGPAAIREVKAIIHSLRTEEWKIFIPQMIPRDHHFESFGDASFIGGGAYSTSLDYWFRVVWSKQIVAGTKLKPSDASYIHINVLECLVSFLQAVALVVTMESSALSDPIHDLFPHGIPAFPVLRCRTDNTATVSWINDTRTTSTLAQALVALYGQLLKRSTLVCHTVHIPGDDNVLADWLSRPDSLSHERLFLQTSQKYPWMNALRNFQPSAELISVLRSALLCSSSPVPPNLPESLGQFVPTASISSAFCVVEIGRRWIYFWSPSHMTPVHTFLLLLQSTWRWAIPSRVSPSKQRPLATTFEIQLPFLKTSVVEIPATLIALTMSWRFPSALF
ncbi:unnamed protein product [Cylindrotheca closterium]|uniref:Uncharacterized protein n=1 Tax=Cylindrotheca closterium TaxID=2856 RepID=A0AAD2PUH2_9STRA|nr:unnamed protein product [Cylindrotheca closterium]